MGKKPKKEPGEKKPSFSQRIKQAFNGVSRKEWMNVVKDTVKDLRKPQEIALLVGCSFLPGGWIGYGIYRIAKYRHKKASNDNQKKADPEAKPSPPKPPSP
jgi:hypothetical protein